MNINKWRLGWSKVKCPTSHHPSHLMQGSFCHFLQIQGVIESTLFKYLALTNYPQQGTREDWIGEASPNPVLKELDQFVEETHRLSSKNWGFMSLALISSLTYLKYRRNWHHLSPFGWRWHHTPSLKRGYVTRLLFEILKEDIWIRRLKLIFHPHHPIRKIS